MQSRLENLERSERWIMRFTELLFASCFLIVCFAFKVAAQSPENSPRRFEKDGLAFDYTQNWELNDQSNPAAQQLVLTEKALDAQIMIVGLRSMLTSTKQEEQAKIALIE